MKEILSFRQVSYRYPADGAEPRDVLDNLSLGLPRGRTTALLGPNGVGKTTLLSLAIGWLKPSTGLVTLDGRSLSGYSRRELGRTIAIVPQYEHIPFDYTVLEYVLLGRAPHLPSLKMPGASDCEIAMSALATTGTAQLALRSVNSLSAGERQLATLARALTQQPVLLLLDEPTAHLDLANKKRLVGVLRSLVPTGTTVVFTTHDPQVAAALADNVVLLQTGGRVLESGPQLAVMTGESLSRAYGIPLVSARVGDQTVILWDLESSPSGRQDGG